LGHFGTFWAIFGHIWAFFGSQKKRENDLKLGQKGPNIKSKSSKIVKNRYFEKRSLRVFVHVLGHFGTFWDILGHFWAFIGGQKEGNDLKLGHRQNRQKSIF